MNALMPARRADPLNGIMVTFYVDAQLFGIPALRVRDVLRRQPITRVPLAGPEIAGAINLRGHIVPAIDLRARLKTPRPEPGAMSMCVVVEKSDPFCLIVDSVGDVITVDAEAIEPLPASLPPVWTSMCRGIHRLNDSLLLIVDIDALLTW
jgi:purine-binding chemotaxis protein CheW